MNESVNINVAKRCISLFEMRVEWYWEGTGLQVDTRLSGLGMHGIGANEVRCNVFTAIVAGLDCG